MSDLSEIAKEAAARVTGLRPDQIEQAVNEYRRAANSLENEPAWTAQQHWSYGDGGGSAVYVDPKSETKVALQIVTDKHGKSEWIYTLNGKQFESYGEARAIEIVGAAKPQPHAVD